MTINTHFKTLVNTWLIQKKPMITPSTHASFTLIAENHLIPYFGKRKIGSITEADVQSFTADGYDVYSIVLPVGTTGFLFTGIKDDGSGATDQSPDILTEGLANESGFQMLWNGANAVEGFTYDPTACVHTYVGGVCSQCGATIAYTVAGTDNLCGTSWDTLNTANDMEYDAAAGVYKKVYSGLAQGSYSFKVVQDHSWGVNWGEGGPNGGNFTVDVTQNGGTLTIIFDGNAVSYEVTY